MDARKLLVRAHSHVIYLVLGDTDGRVGLELSN